MWFFFVVFMFVLMFNNKVLKLKSLFFTFYKVGWCSGEKELFTFSCNNWTISLEKEEREFYFVRTMCHILLSTSIEE